MNETRVFHVWEVNRFNPEIKSELVAVFYSLDAAKRYVDFEFKHNVDEYAIFVNNEKIYPLED